MMIIAYQFPNSSSVPAMPYCPCDLAYSAMEPKIYPAGTYAYPNIGSSQWIGLSFALGLAVSGVASDSPLVASAWYGLSVLFSSDMGGTALNGLDVNMDGGF